MTATPEDLRTAAEAQYARIRSNVDLSPLAKKKAMAQAYLGTKAALDKMKADLEAATNGREESLAKQIYGVPSPADASTILGYRDAQDRADKVEDESAAIAGINRAAIAGDGLMVRALLELSYAQHWAGPINAWTDRNPTKADNAQELWDLTQPNGKPQGAFMGFMEYLAVVPAELTGLSDYVLQELAAGKAITSQQFDVLASTT